VYVGRAAGWPTDPKLTNQRTIIINNSIIVLQALDIRWFLLPNTRQQSTFDMLFVDSGGRLGPPKTLCSLLNTILSELQETATTVFRRNAR
jgi:hypothetical protein